MDTKTHIYRLNILSMFIGAALIIFITLAVARDTKQNPMVITVGAIILATYFMLLYNRAIIIKGNIFISRNYLGAKKSIDLDKLASVKVEKRFGYETSSNGLRLEDSSGSQVFVKIKPAYSINLYRKYVWFRQKQIHSVIYVYCKKII